MIATHLDSTALGETGQPQPQAAIGTASRYSRTAIVLQKREVCGGDFETRIQRSQWGMGWGINLGIPDAVKLAVQVEAVKQ